MLLRSGKGVVSWTSGARDTNRYQHVRVYRVVFLHPGTSQQMLRALAKENTNRTVIERKRQDKICIDAGCSQPGLTLRN